MADDSYKTIKQVAEGILYGEAQPLYLVCDSGAYGGRGEKSNWTNIVNSIMTPAMSAGPIC